ncbi:MAG: phospho-sugar mutase [Firmicutes bacterium]|nr:phospho-sugar mutase [Bacillota bacterium]
MDHRATFELWREKLAGTQWEDQLTAMENDEEAIRNAFSRWVEFGTAGMRGVLGPGPNQLNVFTVRRATQGLADYINSIGQADRGVAIAYDSRHCSDLFAKETALSLAANGVKALLYPEYTSVPQLSYTILHLRCAAGVVITASHNPAKYNGYKVYGPDGGQLANEGADAVLSFIDPIEDCFSLPTMDEGEALAKGLLQYLGPELDDGYVAEVEAQCREREALREFGRQLQLVYTPLNGTGMRTVPRVLSELGLENLHIVSEQRQPDGDFPTVSAPNPEMPEAFDLSRRLADQVGADLLLATDPDCDRLGLALRQPDGGFLTLTGNQIGCLLLDYLLAHTQIRPGDFVVRSLVSTPMADRIAARYGVECRSVLTGFKYIAEQIRLAQESGKGRFLFGFEESYGFLTGTYCRDKDACLAAMLAASAACYWARQGLDLHQALEELYRRYGWHAEKVISLTREGTEGIARIKSAVERLRQDPPAEVCGSPVLAVRDYQNRIRRDAAGQTSPIDLPPSNIVYLELAEGSLIFRPSGTEPKLKTYISVNGSNESGAKARLDELAAAAKDTVDALL